MFRLSRFIDELWTTDTDAKLHLFSICPDIFRPHVDRLPSHLMNPRNCEVNLWCIGHFQYAVAAYCGAASASLFFLFVASRCALVAFSRTLRHLRTLAPLYFLTAVGSSYWLVSSQKSLAVQGLKAVPLDAQMEELVRYGIRPKLRGTPQAAVFRYDSRQAATRPREPLEVALREAALRGSLLAEEFAHL